MLRDRGRESPGFCLQWHLTNACEANCAHCYDRSARDVLPFEEALDVARDLAAFCRSKQVFGGVTLTGGNPFLYPRFRELYREIDRAGFSMAILGNPAPRAVLAEVAGIAPPLFYQLSLEGLPAHNDRVRGAGHFDRAMACLRDLRSLDILAYVMLTLTRDNMDQVLPLAERLTGFADAFSFTRLSAVGNGAALAPPERVAFAGFLREWLEASRHNPMLGTKDNLFNLLRYQNGEPLGRGCSGFGCSLAFDDLVLLPDGEVHACRKFPSPIGNIRTSTFEAIYSSPEAERYRQGALPCAPCPIRQACGGCLACTYAAGGDVFRDLDPYCFLDHPDAAANGPAIGA